MSLPTKDLLGRPLAPTEQRLLAAYEGLKALLKEDLPPSAAANVKEAAAALWQVMNDLFVVGDRPGL